MVVAKKELEYYYPEEEQLEKEKELRKNRNIRKKAKSKSKFKAIGISFVGLIICLFMLYGYANITKIRIEINELENQKKELIKEKEALAAELEAVKSSTKVEEEAMIRLGMDYPTEEQIVYVEVNDDVFAKKEGLEEGKIVAQFKKIFNTMASLF